MPDAAKSGLIFLSIGFVLYLAWRNELAKYIAFATTGAGGVSGAVSATSAQIAKTQSDLNNAASQPANQSFFDQYNLSTAASALYGAGN
jgi:hypothetical protein